MTNKELTASHVASMEPHLLELSKTSTRKMFREKMNAEANGRVDQGGVSYHTVGEHKNRKRAYGDYLFAQDRDIFECSYRRWLKEIHGSK